MKSPLAMTAWTIGVLALMLSTSCAQTPPPAAPRPVPAPTPTAFIALLDPHFPALSPGARNKVIAEVAARIDELLAMADDPNLLMKAATTLERYGSAGSVNFLEYWGENPQTQARLRPIAEAVVKMLAKVDQLASDQADRMANRLGRTW